MFRRAVRTAGITRPIKLHNLRDTFITNALKRGVPAPLVARIAGHDLRTMLSNYSHFAQSDFEAVATLLQRSGE